MKQSKISGGAYKYIQKFYGEEDMSYPGGMPGPGKLSEAQSEELDSNKDGELTGSDFKSLGSSKLGDPETDPSQPTPAETAKSINKFSKSVYDAGYNATRGRGAYVNRDGSSLGFDRKNDKTKPGLPKGVFQDYLGSGGNKNPRVAKDILSKAARFATSETGMKNFVKPNAHSYDRSHYSPTEQFRGVDTQTGKAKTFMSMGGTPEVTKHSDAFRGNMRFGIDLHNKGGVSSLATPQGINMGDAGTLKGDVSGLKSKKVISNPNPNTKNTKKERYQEVKSIFKSNRRKSKR